MIALRLKVILDDVISQVQSAFVLRRLITNCILIAYESMHTIKNNKKGKEGYCAVKLDMHKAYDHAEWVFLERVKMKGFTPTRELCQGDPLSPYLFLICE
jgi:hypothetical protein